MTILIFANGEITPIDWVKSYLDDATILMAADGGAQHIAALGEWPDYIIGDLDSATPELQARLKAADTQFVVHPPEKDETDLELALNFAIEQFDKEILLFGTLGGRLDQTLANILLLAHPAVQGRSIRIIERQQSAWIVDGRSHISGAIGDTVSLIPLESDVQVDHTTGLKWQLHDEKLQFGYPRGVSNVMISNAATVTVHSGKLLCIHKGNKL